MKWKKYTFIWFQSLVNRYIVLENMNDLFTRTSYTHTIALGKISSLKFNYVEVKYSEIVFLFCPTHRFLYGQQPFFYQEKVMPIQLC